jgi:two-component system, NarL family, nitrate/nitrite response regulator NarL
MTALPSDDPERTDVSSADLEAIRTAAAALVRQEGRGVARREIVRLASRSLRLTLLRPRLDDEPVVALVHRNTAAETDRFVDLTRREREVAALIAAGEPNKRIALALGLSVATVKDHVHRILRKTGLGNRAAVASAWSRR